MRVSRFSDVNDCANQPCKNEGICRDLDGDYTCQCRSPYVGKHCQLRTFSNFNISSDTLVKECVSTFNLLHVIVTNVNIKNKSRNKFPWG